MLTAILDLSVVWHSYSVMMTDTCYLRLKPINMVQMKRLLSMTDCFSFNLSKDKISSARILCVYTGVGLKKKKIRK